MWMLFFDFLRKRIPYQVWIGVGVLLCIWAVVSWYQGNIEDAKKQGGVEKVKEINTSTKDILDVQTEVQKDGDKKIDGLSPDDVTKQLCELTPNGCETSLPTRIQTDNPEQGSNTLHVGKVWQGHLETQPISNELGEDLCSECPDSCSVTIDKEFGVIATCLMKP